MTILESLAAWDEAANAQREAAEIMEDAEDAAADARSDVASAIVRRVGLPDCPIHEGERRRYIIMRRLFELRDERGRWIVTEQHAELLEG